VQTQVVANARAFYGTYGGFSYLAPFYGVSSVALYSHADRFLHVHLDVAYRAARALSCGAFDAVPGAVVRTPDGANFIALHLDALDVLQPLCHGSKSHDCVV
jgi:hypothetical protein